MTLINLDKGLLICIHGVYGVTLGSGTLVELCLLCCCVLCVLLLHGHSVALPGPGIPWLRSTATCWDLTVSGRPAPGCFAVLSFTIIGCPEFLKEIVT